MGWGPIPPQHEGLHPVSLLEAHNLPFSAALCVMLLLAVAQGVGAAHFFGDHDVGGDHDGAEGAMGGLLSLLGVGRVPFLIWLALLLLLFAALGLSIQELAMSFAGGTLDAALAAVLAGVVAVPVTALLVRPLAHILPGDETSAVSVDELVGRRGRVSEGVSRQGFPARAQVIDRHGLTHNVMIEPHDAQSQLHAGDEVLLVRREGHLFFATALHDRALSLY